MAATWKIHPNLRVTYRDPRAKDGIEQELGQPSNPGATKFDDIIAWAAREGDGGDLLMTSKGLFFLQGGAAA
jgi:hypothetical protein